MDTVGVGAGNGVHFLFLTGSFKGNRSSQVLSQCQALLPRELLKKRRFAWGVTGCHWEGTGEGKLCFLMAGNPRSLLKASMAPALQLFS